MWVNKKNKTNPTLSPPNIKLLSNIAACTVTGFNSQVNVFIVHNNNKKEGGQFRSLFLCAILQCSFYSTVHVLVV